MSAETRIIKRLENFEPLTKPDKKFLIKILKELPELRNELEELKKMNFKYATESGITEF